MPPAVAAPDAPAPAPRPWRGLRIALLAAALAGALAVALAVAAWTFLAGDAGVRFALRELVARSGGRIDDRRRDRLAARRVQVRRLVWRGADAQAVATDVTLTWRPAALWSRASWCRRSARVASSWRSKRPTSAAALPEDLALPFELAIERLAVDPPRLAARSDARARFADWRCGYAGGAAGHRVADLTLGSDAWTLSGEAGVGGRRAVPGRRTPRARGRRRAAGPPRRR